MGTGLGKNSKKEVVKDIIRKLHQGLSVAEAKERVEKEAGTLTSSEIADIEQSLINEGMSPDEIKKFCSVHALLFETELKSIASNEEAPDHPVSIFKKENRAIEAITAAVKGAIENKQGKEFADVRAEVHRLLVQLKGIELHYERKEQLLFPFLEKHGFPGPSKVMWGKDNEIRAMLREAVGKIDTVAPEQWQDFAAKLNPLIEEVEGMIFKEENILFPTSREKLSADEWARIITESPTVGFAFTAHPSMMKDQELEEARASEPSLLKSTVSLPSGCLELDELLGMLNTLPVDITFVDKDDKVKYFSESKERIFVRTRSVIGRSVQNCHPPQSLHAVEKILDAFKAGLKDSFAFWFPFRDKFVNIRYFAVRDSNREYLGTLEVTQDVSHIKTLSGEKRLLDEKEYYK